MTGTTPSTDSMIAPSAASDEVTKHPTHIPGFDQIARGGLPLGRTTVVSGTAGCGKTVFASQFLVQGIRHDNEPGVFVTFEESPEDIRRNVKGFGWDIAELERQGKWAFVDGSRDPDDHTEFAGAYDLGALIARIMRAIEKISATRVALDSLGAVFSQFSDTSVVRNEMFRIAVDLKRKGVTAVMTAERTAEYGEIARYGIEEFVADNVIIMRNVLEEEKRRRTLEILKFRGTSHQKGEYPFTILPDRGLVIVPLSAIELKQNSSDVRVTSGVRELDEMTSGGYFRDSIVLVSGATGTGKTLLTAEFIKGGFDNGEKVLLFAFEESRDQLGRNARGWGIDFEAMEAEGRLKVVCRYPEVAGPEDHLIHMKTMIDEYKPDRVAIDSLSALERVTSPKSFREFVLSITSFVKHKDMCGLFTATTERLLGGSSITETHISTITDSIILLRYVERFGEVHRGLTVLKMRGSDHDKAIRNFHIDGDGMHIGDQLSEVTGILAGRPVNERRSQGMLSDDTHDDMP